MKKLITLIAMMFAIASYGGIETDSVTLSELTDGWKAGRLWFGTDGMPHFDTGFTNVSVNIAMEDMSFFYNDTGVTIPDGRLINGGLATNGVFRGQLWDSEIDAQSDNFVGMSTLATPAGQIGIATLRGGVTTSGLVVDGLYYGFTNGLMTQTLPTYPSALLTVGKALTTNRMWIQHSHYDRNEFAKSYSWSSATVGSGDWYVGGYYDFDSSDANLNQGSLTVTYGEANVAYSAHPSIVASGAGTVDTGVVGLRVIGTSIDDAGTRTATDTNIISADITTLVADTYYETVKYLGTVTFELYVVSGTPVNYSLDFNYGYSKYEDFGNIDFSLTDVEVVGLAGANDTGFNAQLLHHKSTGWTYSATGFVPGNSTIVTWADDMAPEDNLDANHPFAWKRDNLNTFIDGNGAEGVLFKITTTSGNAVDAMDLHLQVISEELE